MKIYRPVKTNLLTQMYGMDKTQPSLIPLYNSLGLKGHEGFDFAVNCKDRSIKHGGQCEQVYFDLDCTAIITEIQKDDNYGFGIVARSEDQDGLFSHLWWHFDVISSNLKVGDILESGDLLGVAGNTGRSTGAHLHRELRPLKKDIYGVYSNAFIDNGYKGAVDLTPYFIDEFVLEVMEKLTKQLSILEKVMNVFKEILRLR